LNPLAPLLVWRWPGYLRWLFSFRVRPWALRRRGVSVEGEISLAGMPIVSMSAGSAIRIGAGAVLCSDSRATALGVAHPVVLRTLAPGAELTIGKRCRISGASICAAVEVRIGDDVCIGSGAIISDTDFHSLDPVARRSDGDSAGAAASAVAIEDDVFVGANAIVLKGVRIGRGAVVGAGAVVTKDVEAGAIVAGNPARRIGAA
jgi:acetyltransferase-like isoleucine patch superfamily enzyme